MDSSKKNNCLNRHYGKDKKSNRTSLNKAIFKIFTLILLPFLGSAQSIEKFSIDSGGASATAGGIQIVYTIGEVNVQEHSNATLSVSEGFINADFKIKIDPQVFLQGPLMLPSNAGLMNDNLRQNGLIPTTSPYEDGATCNASVFNITGSNAIVDWVWIELRAANDNTKLVNGKSALLQRDGDVVALDGVSDLSMNAQQSTYFVAIKHRNHLGAMTSAAVQLSNTSVNVVNFRSNATTTFGSNAQVVLASGSKALWAGDANANGLVQYAAGTPDPSTILSMVLNNPSNILALPAFPRNGYLNADIDLNGQTQYAGGSADTPIILQNVLANPINILNLGTFPITEQLPASSGRAMRDRTTFETERKSKNN